MYKVYQLKYNENIIYAGSTKQGLKTRLAQHKLCALKGDSKKLAKYIRDNDAAAHDSTESRALLTIHLYAELATKLEAVKLEQELIETLNPICNSMAAYRENHEYYRNHGDNLSHIKKKESRRRQYQKNKQDPVWLANEREKNKLRMRKKRDLIRQDPALYAAYKAKDVEQHRKTRLQRLQSGGLGENQA